MDVLVDNMLGEIAKFGPSDCKGGLSEDAIQAAAKHWSSRSLASLVSDEEEEEASPKWIEDFLGQQQNKKHGQRILKHRLYWPSVGFLRQNMVKLRFIFSLQWEDSNQCEGLDCCHGFAAAQFSFSSEPGLINAMFSLRLVPPRSEKRSRSPTCQALNFANMK